MKIYACSTVFPTEHLRPWFAFSDVIFPNAFTLLADHQEYSVTE